MEKIKEGQTISTNKLEELIKDFLQQENEINSVLYGCRYSSRPLEDIEEEVISDCILYCVSQQIRAVMPED